MLVRPVPPWIAGVLGAVSLLLLRWLESRKPLRRSVEPKLRREARNVSVAGVSAIALALAERPIVMPLAAFVEKQKFGLLHVFRLPLWLETAAALVLMDYTFYVWHVLMHRVPLLWRFHLVHHVDLDLDASTALRFHYILDLARRVPCLHLVSAFQHRASDLMGTVFEQADRDTPDARNSPFHSGAGNELELVERSDALGLAAWNTSTQRTASGNHGRCTSVSGAARGDSSTNSVDAL